MFRKLLPFAVAIPLAAPIMIGAEDKDMHKTDTTVRDAAHKESDAMVSRASKLIGMDVYNTNGEDLGEIHELVLAGDKNKVSYAVLSFGGWMGIGDKLFAIPWKMIEHRAVEPEKTFVNISKEQLKNAPGFDKNSYPTAANTEYWQKVDDFYVPDTTKAQAKDVDDQVRDAARDARDATRDAARDADAQARDAARDVRDAARDGTDAQARDTDAPAATGVAWTRKVSEVIGADVQSPTGENLGEVHELVIENKTGKVRYAVLSFGGLLGIGDKLFALPMNQFKTSADHEHFVLNTSKDQLRNAEGFNKDTWPNFADAEMQNRLDRYYREGTQVRTDMD